MGSVYDCRPENIAAEREYERHVKERVEAAERQAQRLKTKGKLKMSDKSNDWDFGFTTEDEIKGPEIQSTQDKLIGLRDMILPFLNNLKGNPDMDIIKWKGSTRIAQINNFIDKMNRYIEG